MKQNQRILIGLVILLVATFFRLWMFGDVPPGLQHDEIFKAEEGIRLIENGDFRLFYPTNQGHEGVFVWLLGISYMIVGINPLMIKLPAFICGIFTVALMFRFGFRAYSSQVGIVASGLTAVSFWAVFASRVGLRAVMLPMVVLLVLLGIHTLLTSTQSQNKWRVPLVTGLILGFAIYTYTSSFALHLTYALFLPILWLSRRDVFRENWLKLLVVGIIGAIITMPMVYIRITDPQGDNRVNSITTPLQEAQAGNPQLLIDNAFKLAGMPAFVGDPTWRYNVAGRPLFMLPIGLMVYMGILITLVQVRRNPLNFMLLGLTFIGLIPSLVTVLAPSFLRSIIIMPSVMLFIGITVAQISRLFPKYRWIGWSLTIAIISITAITDYQAYFVDWAKSQNPTLAFHDESEQGATVFEIYRDDLQQLAQYLTNRDESLVFVSTPDSELDPLIYKYSGVSSPDKTHIVFFNAFANIILSEEPTLLFVSTLSPISEKHANWLTADYGTTLIDQILRQDGIVAFDVYQLNDTSTTLTQTLSNIEERQVYITVDNQQLDLEYPVNFGNLLLLRGLEIPRETVYGENDGVNNQLYFQPLVQSSGATLNVFLHLVNNKGEVVAQRDLLGVSPAYWHPNSIFMQDNFVPFWERVPRGNYNLIMGVYDWRIGVRIPILDETGKSISDQVFLANIEVIDLIE
jgi:4-amino-4-deoxy-L-arabinose transferase-like glycosyltransferase